MIGWLRRLSYRRYYVPLILQASTPHLLTFPLISSLYKFISFHLTNLFLFIFFYNFFLPCMDFVWNMPIQEMKNQERDGFQTSNSTRFATIFGLRNLSPASCGRGVGPCSELQHCYMNPYTHKFLFFSCPFSVFSNILFFFSFRPQHWKLIGYKGSKLWV